MGCLKLNHIEENTLLKVSHRSESLGATSSARLNRKGYQGEFAEKDEETGFDSFYLRQYDARIGRWTSTDPYNQFHSPYIGLGNNPHMMVDPDGGFSFVGATIMALVGGYAGGVISSGEWNPGKWEGKDWMWVGVGAGAGFIGGGFLGEALHSTSSHIYSGHANAWDRFTAKFGEGTIRGSRYIADAPSIGKLKFPKFSGWLSKTVRVPHTGHSGLENTIASFNYFPMKFGQKHVKGINFAVNTSSVVFDVFNGGRNIFSNRYSQDLTTPTYRNNGNVFRPVVTKNFTPTNMELTDQEIQELMDMGVDPATMLPGVPVPGTNIDIRIKIRVKRINYQHARLMGWQ